MHVIKMDHIELANDIAVAITVIDHKTIHVGVSQDGDEYQVGTVKLRARGCTSDDGRLHATVPAALAHMFAMNVFDQELMAIAERCNVLASRL